MVGESTNERESVAKRSAKELNVGKWWIILIWLSIIQSFSYFHLNINRALSQFYQKSHTNKGASNQMRRVYIIKWVQAIHGKKATYI